MMKSSSKNLLAFGLMTTIVLTGCQSAEKQIAAHSEKIDAVTDSLPDGSQPLINDALQNYVSDSTLSGDSKRSPGWKYTIYYTADGKLRGESNNGTDTSVDTGTWWIEKDNMVCGKFSKWADGKTWCSKYYAQGEQITKINDDGTVSEENYVKGNPKNL